MVGGEEVRKYIYYTKLKAGTKLRSPPGQLLEQVHRKATGGFRSEWGAKPYTALASVINTTALKG